MNHTAHTDLLLGLLAFQMDWLDIDELRTAMREWMRDRTRPLAEILVERETIDEETRRLLTAMVNKHLELHQGKPEDSLAAIASTRHDVLRQLVPAGEDLETTWSRMAGDTDLTPPPPSRGSSATPLDSAPRFRILRPHAQGGLGKVSVALDQQLSREVAFKEMQARFADDLDSRARFLREAQLTGALEHPGIVPVYALGTDANGLPYYAMRFIRGETLKAAIDKYHGRGEDGESRPQLELRKLLNRFVAVCNAVEYAHSRGILHRDLKPANIMLGEFGETLVVDWGLAKRTGSDAETGRGDELALPPGAAASMDTRPGSVIGTPAYMSPEQAAGDVASLTGASDVYSLGATLYHILTGRPPFTNTAKDVLQEIRQGRFPRPREVVPSVPRSLEAICCKAMASETERRYASPREMAEDLERYLADEPVLARRESLAERAERWVRKHRSWALAGAAALAVVTLVSAVAALVVNHQKQQIAVARDTAERHVDHAQQVLDTFGELSLELGELPQLMSSVRSPLEAATDLYRRFLAEEAQGISPRRAAKAYGNLATLEAALHNFDTAEELYKQSLAAYEKIPVSERPPSFRSELFSVYGNLGALYQSSFEGAAAQEVFDQVVRLQEEHLRDNGSTAGLEERALARSYFNRGLLLTAQRPADAVQDFRRAIELQTDIVSREPNVLDTQLELDAIRIQLGVALLNRAKQLLAASPPADAAEVRQLPEQSLSLLREVVGDLQARLEEHPREPRTQRLLAVANAELGAGLAQTGRLPEAEQQIRLAIEHFDELAADLPRADSRRKQAQAYFSLGLLKSMAGETDSAVSAYRTAIDLQEKLTADFPDRLPYTSDLVRSWTNLALVQSKAGDSAAVASIQRSASLAQQAWRRMSDEPAVASVPSGELSANMREFVHRIYYGAAQICLQHRAHAELAGIGEAHADLRPDSAREAYVAARLLALACGMVDETPGLNAAEREEFQESYGSRAVQLIRRSLEGEFRPEVPLRIESDFHSLRERADFQSLVERFERD